MTHNPPGISAIVVNYNTLEASKRCLASLQEHRPTGAFEIIVIDNASTDGSGRCLGEEFPDITVVANQTNVGFARACNQGMREAKYESLLLFNSDAFLEEPALDVMRQKLHGRPDIGAVGCQLLDPNGRIQHTANRSLSIWRTLLLDLWIFRLVPRSKWPTMFLNGYFDHRSEVEADWLAAAVVMIRREAFEASGGFDETFFMYGEDSEWFMRLRRLGFRIVFTPQVRAVHVGSVSSTGDWSRREWLRLCHLGGIRAYQLHHGTRRAQIYRGTRLIGASVRAAVYSLVSRFDKSSYFQEQALEYRALAGIYLRPYRSI